jgi:hypothetical protein
VRLPPRSQAVVSMLPFTTRMPNREPNPSVLTTVEPEAIETITPDMLLMMMVMGGFGGSDGGVQGVVAAPKYVEPESIGGSRTGKKGW